VLLWGEEGGIDSIPTAEIHSYWTAAIALDKSWRLERRKKKARTAAAAVAAEAFSSSREGFSGEECF